MRSKISKKKWRSLKRGDTLIMRSNGRKRKIIHSNGYGCITLRKINFATHTLWSGKILTAKPGDITVYASCDRWMFKLP